MSSYLSPKISNEVQRLSQLSATVTTEWDRFLRLADRDRIAAADGALHQMQALIREIRSDLNLEDTYTAEAQEVGS
ncbi:hypothetical protein ACFP47_10355 [Nesterenkonia lacusekhoensis]|uniref:Uncharacterized protein n=1 Tax=Nesterenkonia lacusekhoensis TaxID=150832 RepID=A0ABS4T5A1_9MICC|nr:hypothetical protein [Nesterenkonia lacusekhoensis]MBP2319603.1 hypothetical protein [Nesterenkonia lacusekhoensis]